MTKGAGARDTPRPLNELVRARMSSQRRSGTQPEIDLRRALHRGGLRFRVEYPVPGLPRRSIDIAFTRARVAVFVDGCFWHGCPTHSNLPKNNAEWWTEKLAANQRRDAETTTALEVDGWTVVRLWEHVPLDEAVASVVTTLNGQY